MYYMYLPQIHHVTNNLEVRITCTYLALLCYVPALVVFNVCTLVSHTLVKHVDVSVLCLVCLCRVSDCVLFAVAGCQTVCGCAVAGCQTVCGHALAGSDSVHYAVGLCVVCCSRICTTVCGLL